VGEEVRSREGEIIGLFITASIPDGGTPEAICDAIHAMGGLTYACHPLDRRRSSFSEERLVELAPRLDIIEIHNSWAPPAANEAAAAFCRDLGKVAASASDAHAPAELGRCWMEVEPFEGPSDFLANLRRARHVVNAPSASGRRS
jgi:predicted metal-dependent phosphoesterase TrpH